MHKMLRKMLLVIMAFSIFVNSGVILQAQESEEESDQEVVEFLKESEELGYMLVLEYDADGNLVENKLPYPESRSPGVWMTIAVGVATHVIGTLVVRVVDGIVKEIESQPGWWVSEAARQVLGKPFVDNISIDCSVYPPNSYEGAMCRAV